MVATGRTFLFRRSFSTRVLRLLLIIGIISPSNHGETFEQGRSIGKRIIILK